MPSDTVDLAAQNLHEMIMQSLRRKGGDPSQGTVSLDQFPNHLGEPTKKQKRSEEDATTIGGLRSPHMAVANWPSVAEYGCWLRTIIDGLPGIDAPQIEGAIATLGQDGIPTCIKELACALRQTLCASLGATAWAKEGLQGSLIYRLATHLGDRDRPVREWLRDGVVPLGIECPIEPAGIFPLSCPSAAEHDVDVYCGAHMRLTTSIEKARTPLCSAS